MTENAPPSTTNSNMEGMTMDKREAMLIYPEFFSEEDIQDEFPHGVHSRVNQLALNVLSAVAGVVLLALILGLLTGRI